MSPKITYPAHGVVSRCKQTEFKCHVGQDKGVFVQEFRREYAGLVALCRD